MTWLDVANFVVALIALGVTGVIGAIALRLQAASSARDRRADRRLFADAVDQWARAAEQKNLNGSAVVDPQILRRMLDDDARALDKRDNASGLLAYVDAAFARVETSPSKGRGNFIAYTDLMREWTLRQWVATAEIRTTHDAVQTTVNLSSSGQLHV